MFTNREFVIRFGGRFVQLTKRGLCPVTEKANFENPNRISLQGNRVKQIVTKG